MVTSRLRMDEYVCVQKSIMSEFFSPVGEEAGSLGQRGVACAPPQAAAGADIRRTHPKKTQLQGKFRPRKRKSQVAAVAGRRSSRAARNPGGL